MGQGGTRQDMYTQVRGTKEYHRPECECIVINIQTALCTISGVGSESTDDIDLTNLSPGSFGSFGIESDLMPGAGINGLLGL